MLDNFKKAVDNFDSGVLRNMNEEEKLVNEIAKASRILGENQLRSELDILHENYMNSQARKKWMLRIAASIVIVLGIGALFFTNQESANFQPLKIDEQPIYSDSAIYHMDSLQFISDPDSLKQLNEIK